METANCVRAPGKRLQPRAVWFVLSLHRWAPQMRYEQGEMICSRTESTVPSLGSRQQEREMPWRFSLCIIVPCRRDQSYEKRIMVSCMRDSGKSKMMRQEGKVRHLSEAGLTHSCEHGVGGGRADTTLREVYNKTGNMLWIVTTNRSASALGRKGQWGDTVESSEVKELFFKSREISSHFIWGERSNWKWQEEKDPQHVLSILKEVYRIALKSPPELLFCPHGPTSCLGLIGANQSLSAPGCTWLSQDGYAAATSGVFFPYSLSPPCKLKSFLLFLKT